MLIQKLLDSRFIHLILLLLFYFISIIGAQLFSKEFTEDKFWVSDTTIPEFDANRVKRSVDGCEELEVRLGRRKNFLLCIFRESILTYDFLDERTTFTEDITNNKNYITTPIHKTDYVRITGYVIGHKDTSKVDGYILHKKLLGRVFLNDEVFYIDELVMYLPGIKKSNQSVVFNVSNMSGLANPYEYKRRRRRQDTNSDAAYYEGKEVHIALHLDPAWYIFPNKYSRKRSIFGVVHIIHVMNSVYRSTDFFGIGRPSNIGFFLKKILLTKNNYKLDMAPCMANRIREKAILDRFLNWNSVSNDKTVDMHMLYTGQETQSGVNGFSPVGKANNIVGGICAETRNGMFMNSLYMDYYTLGGSDQHMLDAASAHEMGHSFGARHDPPDESPDTDPKANCRYFLMTPLNDKSANFEKGFHFSTCSLEAILPVLADPTRRKCFHDPTPNRQPFCGNSMVDAGEECDCGNKYYCDATKNCCNSYDSVTGLPCTYRVDKSGCKPPDGLCCTGSCQFRNLTHLDLSCGPHCTAGCPCPKNLAQLTVNGITTSAATKSSRCSCGINGECRADECHSAECTRIGLAECMCPTPSSSGCRTCCEWKDQCMEATVATAEVLQSGVMGWESVQKAGIKSKEIKSAIYKRFCASDKEDKCTWLMFRQFPHGEYCLKNGHVGKCTVHSICLVENEILHRQNRPTSKTIKKL